MYTHILKRGLEINPTGIAIICDDVKLTYKEMQNEVIKYTGEFTKCGIKKGSKVMIGISNPLEFVLSLFALEYIEAVPMPVYSKTGVEKLEAIVNRYNINYGLLSVENNRLQADCSKVMERINVFSCSDIADDSIADAKLVLFTSGTTSEPKAIMLSKENLTSNVMAISEYLQLGCEDNILLIKDLSHSSSIVGELFVGLYNGCTVVLTTKLPMTAYMLNIMEKEKISVFFAVPTLLKGILMYDKLKEYDLSMLRIINFYGASMNPSDINQLIKNFNKANIIYSYGQTEASPRITYIEKKDIVKYPGSCGRAIRDVNIKIMDSNGDEVPYGESGEITITGPNIMMGYYMNEEKTKRVIREGRLFTGDIGVMNEDGYLYVTGRKDNMIISAGKNIYPEEIEGVLQSYENIAESLVVPEIKENGTCILRAYVVLKDKEPLDNSKMFVFLRDHLENYKIPKEVVIAEALEKTASGKIKRKQSLGMK